MAGDFCLLSFLPWVFSSCPICSKSRKPVKLAGVTREKWFLSWECVVCLVVRASLAGVQAKKGKNIGYGIESG